MEQNRHIIYSAKDLGIALRAQRKERGYSQQDISDMTGYSRRFIGDVERGKATVGFDRAVALMNWLGLDLIASPRS